MTISISYIDKLQRENAVDLGFYPLTTLAKALEERHVISCEENGEPAGYLWFGALRGGYDVIVYQACVDYDARRQHLGFGMIRDLRAIATMAGCSGIRLKCASSAAANEFWRAAGFVCTAVVPGGRARGRDLNCYRTDILAGIWTPEDFAVEPSTKSIDRSSYERSVRRKSPMPSRFSRSHY